MASTKRSILVATGLGAASVLVVAGCSSNSDSTPSSSPTPVPTSASASPTSSPTSASPKPTSASNKYTVKSGSYAQIAGQGAGKWPATGGTMVSTPSGTGPLAGSVEVAAKGNATKGDWILVLKTDGKGNVESGSLTAPGVSFKVTGKGGQINYLTTGAGTTLTTTSPIPVQSGTATPTTMTLNITGTK